MYAAKRLRRWRLRRAALRALRGARRHYASLASAVVLGVALTAVLTSASFDTVPRPLSEPAVAASEAGPPSDTAAPPDTAAGSPDPELLREQRVVYYIVGSVEQWETLYSALRSDAIYAAQQPHQEHRPDPTFFMLIDTPAREAEAARLLHMVAEMGPAHGIHLQVLDLRE